MYLMFFFFITIFGLAISAFFRLTDVPEFMTGITILCMEDVAIKTVVKREGEMTYNTEN